MQPSLIQFDYVEQNAGASELEIQVFTESVFNPLTQAEIDRINRSQQNPFPKNDRYYDLYHPFDPSVWILPKGKLCGDFFTFMKWSNGGAFYLGERIIQLFALEEIRGFMLAYNIPEYMPKALPFAFNGGGRFYLFDMRNKSNNGEYPIVCAPAGGLGWSEDSFRVVSSTFQGVFTDSFSIDDLFN